MKQKLLFVMPSLSAGGGERSLINLLTQIDYTQYIVDLYLLSHEGLFMEMVPDDVRLLPLPESYTTFALPLPRSLKRLLRDRKLKLAINRVMFSLSNRSIANVGKKEQTSWRFLSQSISDISQIYDVAIGFLEKTSIYFCVDKVNAKMKIGWVHNDYDKLGMDPEFDRHYFDRLNHIVTVSEECASVLKIRFPDQEKKIHVIYNIVSPVMIQRMAGLETIDVYNRSENEFVILSIGRLHPQKNFELSIMACKELKKKGYKLQWNIIGEGEERHSLEEKIKANGLEDCFKLLGLKSNPYPYLQQADIYVQSSKFEGKSIAIDEAKILNKPIVITNFSTAKDQLIDGVEGIIVEMNPEALVDSIGMLMKDNILRERLSSYLSGQMLGTESEIEKLYQLLG